MSNMELELGEFSRVKVEAIRPEQLIPSDVGRRVYVPLEPVDMYDRTEKGWTFQEIARAAIRDIPIEFEVEKERAIDLIIKLCTSPEPPKKLFAFGPDEGLYYLVLTDEQPHEIMIGDIQ